jgi:hypothetical protein
VAILDFIVVRRYVDAAEPGRNRHDSQAPGAWVTTATRGADRRHDNPWHHMRHAQSAGGPTTTEPAGQHRRAPDVDEHQR